MQVVRELDEATWRCFVERQPLGNVFHSPEMFRVFSMAKGHLPELWAVLDEAGNVGALMMPVRVSIRQGALRGLTTRSIVYGGPLCRDDDQGRAALGVLLSGYEASVGRKSLLTEFRNLSDLSSLRSVFEAGGYVYEDHLNFLVDLDRPPEDVMQGIRTKTRKAIRKGIRDARVMVREVTDRAEMEDWYDLLQRTYRHATVPLADRSLFDATFDILRPVGMAKLLLARVDGAPVACSAELPYKDTIFGWYGGSDRAYSRFLPNEILTWHVLEWGANSHASVYDFGGAGKPDKEYGVREFKAKFGGELVNFGRYVRVHTPVRLKASSLGYGVYQRFERLRVKARS